MSEVDLLLVFKKMTILGLVSFGRLSHSCKITRVLLAITLTLQARGMMEDKVCFLGARATI